MATALPPTRATALAPDEYYTIDSLIEHLTTLPGCVLVPVDLENPKKYLYKFPSATSQEFSKVSSSDTNEPWNVLNFLPKTSVEIEEYTTVERLLKFLLPLQTQGHGHSAVSIYGMVDSCSRFLFRFGPPRLILQFIRNETGRYYKTSINPHGRLGELLQKLHEKFKFGAFYEEIDAICALYTSEISVTDPIIYITDSDQWMTNSEFELRFCLKPSENAQLFIQPHPQPDYKSPVLFRYTRPGITSELLQLNFGARSSVEEFVKKLPLVANFVCK